MDIATMRALVQIDLHDETNDVWSNDEVDRAVQLAVQEFSRAIPDEDEHTSAAVAVRDLNIAALTTRVVISAVEYPTGNYPKTYVRFSVWGDTLSLLVDTAPDGSHDAEIFYGKMHDLGVATSTIPVVHERLIAAGGAGFALQQWGVEGTNKTNVGGKDVARTYAELAGSKLTYFRLELRRLGRENRVRVRTLYAPHYPIVSKNTVVGP